MNNNKHANHVHLCNSTIYSSFHFNILMDSTIDIHVGGIKFHLKHTILHKIPYFYNELVSLTNETEIHVDRSSIGFQHVLGLIYDPLYPFPIEYAFELDFYGVAYDRSKLHNPQREILKKMDFLHNGAIYNARLRKYEGFTCMKSGCTAEVNRSRAHCPTHESLCIIAGCGQKVTDSNYCDAHNTVDRRWCTTKGCNCVRIYNYMHCFQHAQWIVYKDDK
jgi:hypothetical protein